jgi:hypothetical protein
MGPEKQNSNKKKPFAALKCYNFLNSEFLIPNHK